MNAPTGFDGLEGACTHHGLAVTALARPGFDQGIVATRPQCAHADIRLSRPQRHVNTIAKRIIYNQL